MPRPPHTASVPFTPYPDSDKGGMDIYAGDLPQQRGSQLWVALVGGVG